MSSRLPRSPHVSHSTANGHSTSTSYAKSHVLAGVQDAYWSDDEAENLECPLCLEEMDLSDLHFKPCPCGYQICNFCWHHIKENLNGRCPACRREYTEQPAEFKSVTAEEQKRLNAQKRKRDKERKELEALNRRHLANVRIVQRNLVYVTGLGSRFAKEELIPSLRSSEYFGQYGKVSKILLVKRVGTVNRAADVGVYITYHRREDAARAIAAVDGSPSPGGGSEVMRASYGTTKYCINFLRGVQCTNHSCLDLHEWGDERDCFTKEDLATLKHAMKDTEARQVPTAAPRKRAEEAEGMPPPPMGAALPRGASWGQNRGALPHASATLSSSASSAFPAISANQTTRQARSAKGRSASATTPASERPATPSRSRRNRDRPSKPADPAFTASAVPPGLATSRPSTPGLSNQSSRPSTASRSPQDAFKSPPLAAAQAVSLTSVEEPTGDVNLVETVNANEDDGTVPQLVANAVPPPPPGLSLPAAPPGLAPASQHSSLAHTVGLARPPGFDHVPSQPQYQMSGAAKALLDDVRARRESAPHASTQQSPFPDFDRTLSNLTGGGFSFSFDGFNSRSRETSGPTPYGSSTPDGQESISTARGVSGVFDPFRKSEQISSLPPPPGLSVTRGPSKLAQSSLSAHTEPQAAYTGAFNPFSDGVGAPNRSGSYDSERDVAERTSSRFGFARRQDSFGQSSVGYSTSATSSPRRIVDQLPSASTYGSEASASPAPPNWPYLHSSAAEYDTPGVTQQMPLGPSPLQQHMYAPPGIAHPQFSDDMELNTAGLKELLNIGNSNGRLDTHRSQTDSFDPRFGSQPFHDPAIMSVAPQDTLGFRRKIVHSSLSPGPEPSILTRLDYAPAVSTFQPPATVSAPVMAMSPPPGFARPTGHPRAVRQPSQKIDPDVVRGIATSDSLAPVPTSTTKSESVSLALSISDFPALPPPSTELQQKRETNQPFILPSRTTTTDAKAVVAIAKKATSSVSKKSGGKTPEHLGIKTTIPEDNPTLRSNAEAKPAPNSSTNESASMTKELVIDMSTKRAKPRVSVNTMSSEAPLIPKNNTTEQVQGSGTRNKPNSIFQTDEVTKSTPASSVPRTPTSAIEPAEQVPVLSRKPKKSKPASRHVAKVSKDEPGESAPPSAPSSPVSTLVHFEDGPSSPTPQTAEPAPPVEPPLPTDPTLPAETSVIRMFIELASQYEIENLSFFDGPSYRSKSYMPLRYGPPAQEPLASSTDGRTASRATATGAADTASRGPLAEILTQTLSDLHRRLPRAAWGDAPSFDGALKDTSETDELLEDVGNLLVGKDDASATTLKEAARWPEVQSAVIEEHRQLRNLERQHRDANVVAVRWVLEKNDQGWGPRVRERKGESLARFEQLGYINEEGTRRPMTVVELEAAVKQAKKWEEEAEQATQVGA